MRTLLKRLSSSLAFVLVIDVVSALAQTPTPAPTASDDDVWSRVKFGATFEGYYEYDWNKPPDRVIPLRAYDTRSNSFSIQQAAVVVDAPPDIDKNRRYGLRIDLQFGQATETLQGNPANEPRPDIYRAVWQLLGSYVFPIGRGLQVDFGKFGSNLGYETNYAKDNFNFSRALLFDFLPFYHTGLRTTLPVSDRLTVMYMLTNGIQETEDFNNFKSNHFTAIVKPVAAVTSTTSYYFGQEQPDGGKPGGPNGWFRVFDTQGTIVAAPRLTFAYDLTHVSNQRLSGDPTTTLFGLAGYARYQLNTGAAFAARYERLDDEGLFVGIDQLVQEITLTGEYKFADGFLIRGEFRRDWSDTPFFSTNSGVPSAHQNTALVGLIWWIGNKTGSW
jgi:hypothetical protein